MRPKEGGEEAESNASFYKLEEPVKVIEEPTMEATLAV